MESSSNLIHGMPYEDYHAAEGFRSSYLHSLKRSPAHFQAEKDVKKTSPAMEFGKLFHSALENGEKFLDLATVEPEFSGLTKDGKESAQSGEAKEKRKKWRSNLKAGSIVLTKENYETLVGMLKAISNHRIARNMIKDGTRETSGFVRCPETGLMLKFRPDLITTRGHIVDYKSTKDARYWPFYYEIFSDRPGKRFYVLSAAHYSYCAKLMGLPRHDTFTYIAVEKTPPYGINVFPLDDGCLDVGETIRAPLMRLYVRCMESGIWPGYDEKVKPVSPPEFSSEYNTDIQEQMEEDDEND